MKEEKNNELSTVDKIISFMKKAPPTIKTEVLPEAMQYASGTSSPEKIHQPLPQKAPLCNPTQDFCNEGYDSGNINERFQI